MSRVDSPSPLPWSEQGFNNRLSPVIGRSLGREMYVYGDHRDRGLLATLRGGLYQACTYDVPSIQLTIRPGWVLPPLVQAQLGAGIQPGPVGEFQASAQQIMVPPRQVGDALPRLPWQVQPAAPNPLGSLFGALGRLIRGG